MKKIFYDGCDTSGVDSLLRVKKETRNGDICHFHRPALFTQTDVHPNERPKVQSTGTMVVCKLSLRGWVAMFRDRFSVCTSYCG